MPKKFTHQKIVPCPKALSRQPVQGPQDSGAHCVDSCFQAYREQLKQSAQQGVGISMHWAEYSARYDVIAPFLIGFIHSHHT